MSLKDLLHYIRTYRRYIGRRLYIVFVLTIASAVAEGLGITLLLPLLRTTGQTQGNGSSGSMAGRWLNAMLKWMGIADSMLWILVFIGVVFLLKGLLNFASSAYRGLLQAKLLRDLKSKLYAMYSHMNYEYYLKKNTGHFINVITQQVNQFFQSFSNFTNFITRAVMTASYFLIAFAITWKFAAMALVVGLLVTIMFRFLNSYVRNLSRNVSSERSELNKQLVQGLQALKYIMSTGQTEKMEKSVNNSVNRLTYYIRWQRLASAFTGSLKEPISIFFIVSIIAIQVGVMHEPIAPMFVAILLFNRGMQSMMSIQMSLQKTMDRIGALEMVDEEFRTVRERQESNGSQRLDTLQQQISFEHLSFAYGADEKPALDDITLTIPARSTVAFVGESGAGKSTLVDLLNLLLKPGQGRLVIDGQDSRTLEVSSWRQQLGYVSQETVVFDDTVANNISLWTGDYNADEDFKASVEEAARKAHAHDFIMDLAEGYQTRVGERGVRLSGGQRQRLFIARELFKKPNLLILDEATSALDTQSERYIQESIDALKGEITVVIIAHRLSTIKNVDQVFVLDEGRLVEHGSYDKLVGMGESRFREMVDMQSL